MNERSYWLHSYISPLSFLHVLFCLTHVNTALIYLAPPMNGIKYKTQLGDCPSVALWSLTWIRAPLQLDYAFDIDQIQLYQINKARKVIIGSNRAHQFQRPWTWAPRWYNQGLKNQRLASRTHWRCALLRLTSCCWATGMARAEPKRESARIVLMNIIVFMIGWADGEGRSWIPSIFFFT